MTDTSTRPASARVIIWLCDGITRICLIIAGLSLRQVHAIGGVLGKWVYWLSPAYRNRLRNNLAGAGYADPALVMAAAAEAGRRTDLVDHR